MRHSRGDVVLALFPDSNLRTAKRRPVLIVQADDLATGLPQVIVAMISSNLDRAGHVSRVTVARGSHDSIPMELRTDSVIMTDNLATLRDEEIGKRIGHCPCMSLVDDALRASLAI